MVTPRDSLHEGLIRLERLRQTKQGAQRRGIVRLLRLNDDSGSLAFVAAKTDLFICHASEDKDFFVRPLAVGLRSLGASVWYDEFSLRPGDSLSRSIDRGIGGSKNAVVVVSGAFIAKAWPEHELRGLVAREIAGEVKIIPIWHGVTHREVLAYSPTLADKVAIVTTDQSATDVALQVLMVVRPDLYEAHPRAELVRIANGEAMAELQESIEDLKAELAEFQCPICGSPLVETARVNHEYGDDLVQIFECGRGYNSLCPSDPRFPNLSEYDLVTNYYPENEPYAWQCWGIPMTENARLLSVHGRGKSEEEARIDAIREYAAAARTWPKGDPFTRKG